LRRVEPWPSTARASAAMESNFRSTVLQHPSSKDDDRERRHPRDILNPTSPVGTTRGSQPQGPPRHSAFSLRSPTQSEFHPPPAFSPSPSAGISHHHSSPRPALSSFMSPVTTASPNLPSIQHTSGGHHRGSPLSPLRGSSAYYPSQTQDVHQPREKHSGGRLYDPTTDTTTGERRVVEATGAWHRGSNPQVSLGALFSSYRRF
jgi:DNA helicase INO80